MKLQRAGLLFVCAAAAVMVSAPVASENKLRSRLDAGEIIVSVKEVKGFDIPSATVTAVVDAPPEDLWAIIGNCADYERNMIRVLEAKQISKKGDQVVCEVTTDMPWPIANLTALTTAKHVEGPPVWSRTWVMIKGDFETNKGSWRIQSFDAMGKRSLIVYQLHAVPDMMVPDSLIRKAQKDTLPKLIKHLRKKAIK